MALGSRSRVSRIDLFLTPQKVEIYEEVIKQIHVVYLDKILNFT